MAAPNNSNETSYATAQPTADMNEISTRSWKQTLAQLQTRN